MGFPSGPRTELIRGSRQRGHVRVWRRKDVIVPSPSLSPPSGRIFILFFLLHILIVLNIVLGICISIFIAWVCWFWFNHVTLVISPYCKTYVK